MELEKDTRRMVLVAMKMACLAALLASLLPGMAEWSGIHWMKMEEEMELIELWIEEVGRFYDVRASHKDLLLEHGDWRMVGIGGYPGYSWFYDNFFLLVRAGEPSVFGFDGGNHFRLDWGSSGSSCCCVLIFPPSTSGSIGVDGVIGLVWCNECETALAFQINSISPVSNTRNRVRNLFLSRNA